MGEASREFMRRARKQVPEWTPSQVQEALTWSVITHTPNPCRGVLIAP